MNPVVEGDEPDSIGSLLDAGRWIGWSELRAR
jgi:hypothetical protein